MKGIHCYWLQSNGKNDQQKQGKQVINFDLDDEMLELIMDMNRAKENARKEKGKMGRERNWELENKRKEEGVKDYWRGKEDEAVIETADKEKKENRVLKRKRITRGKRPPRRRLKRIKTIQMKLKKKGWKASRNALYR